MSSRRAQIIAALVALTLVASSCGSRLNGSALSSAENAAGAGAVNGAGSGNSNYAANTGAGSGSSNPTSGGGTGTGGSSTSGTTPSAGSTATGSSGVATASNSGAGALGTGPNCSASSNGGATDVGVSANQITIGNIASISGVAPGLTQSAQQATQAFASYVNSQGGICGRLLKVQPYDDGNTSQGNYQGAESACSSQFAMVGNASGFDDGAASAVSSCGIPDVAAEVSTHAAGNVAQIFGATPGNAHHWPTGAGAWLHQTYPNAVTKAAMVYLNVPATQEQATAEMSAYQTQGFKYIYTVAVSPTEPNYAPYVQKMQSAGVQYVTEYSDDNSAARLELAMQQANFNPVVDWFSEMYTPAFLQETQGAANGHLVLMATNPYEDAASNPGMQLMLSWMNRVAPGFTHDIFAEFAWSAGLAFQKAALAVGGHLTRSALLQQLAQIHNWTGGGMQPTTDFGNKIPSPCFSYFKISSNGYSRVYPSGQNSWECNMGTTLNY